jgi:hypothetical protein
MNSTYIHTSHYIYIYIICTYIHTIHYIYIIYTLIYGCTARCSLNTAGSAQRASEVSQRQAADDEVAQAWTDWAGSVFDCFRACERSG